MIFWILRVSGLEMLKIAGTAGVISETLTVSFTGGGVVTSVVVVVLSVVVVGVIFNNELSDGLVVVVVGAVTDTFTFIPFGLNHLLVGEPIMLPVHTLAALEPAVIVHQTKQLVLYAGVLIVKFLFVLSEVSPPQLVSDTAPLSTDHPLQLSLNRMDAEEAATGP
jgi:hypothetical protein